MYIVSRCLLGENCKYNGGNNFCEEVLAFSKEHNCCLVCPEEEGGLKTPRLPAEIKGTKILNKDGVDVTEYFLNGSKLSYLKAKKLAEELGETIEGAILKANSPSCGMNYIYDGSFKGILVEGNGIFADLLTKNGIEVKNEKENTDGKF